MKTIDELELLLNDFDDGEISKEKFIDKAEDKLFQISDVLSRAIIPENYVESQKMKILKRIDDGLSLPQLEKLEKDLGLQPDYHPDKLKTA